MAERAYIETMAEFQLCIDRGHNPLMDYRHFIMDVSLRISLQRQIFGHSQLSKGNVPKANQRFYEYMWANSEHYCEECLRPLWQYSAEYISHILSRGGHADMAHDPRNVNILCPEHHRQWEVGNRKKMRIYERNEMIILRLKRDYAGR